MARKFAHYFLETLIRKRDMYLKGMKNRTPSTRRKMQASADLLDQEIQARKNGAKRIPK